MPTLSKDMIYAAVAGASVALVYKLVVAYQAGSMATAWSPELLPTLGIGALAGVAAMWLRGQSGS